MAKDSIKIAGHESTLGYTLLKLGEMHQVVDQKSRYFT
jgi:hypothetical protein